MTARSTRSTTDLTRTVIDSLLLLTKPEKHSLASMENSQQSKIDVEKQQVDLNQNDDNKKC